MGHEVRATARHPYRSLLGLGALLVPLLALLLAAIPALLPSPGPQLEVEACVATPRPFACAQALAEDPALHGLPEPAEVRNRCFAAVRVEPWGSSLCGEASLQAARESPQRGDLTYFVRRLPRGGASSGFQNLEGRNLSKAQDVADLYAGEREVVLRAYFREVNQQRERAKARKDWFAHGVGAWLWGGWCALAVALLGSWFGTRPVQVVIWPGRVRIGSRTASLEEVDSWEFRAGRPRVRLTDGTRLGADAGQVLDAADALALDEAMRLARERVDEAQPFDAQAFAGVRKLAE